MTPFSIDDLKLRKQWICWQRQDSSGRKAKVPKNPYNGYNAKTNDPTTWGTYDDCMRARLKYGFDGVGIILTDGLCGIDVDALNHGSDKESENPIAQDLLKLFKGTYAEYSPSGKGVHILGLADTEKLPIEINKEGIAVLSAEYYSKNPHENIEIYIAELTNRFFTFTGQKISGNMLTDITAETNELIQSKMRRIKMSNKDLMAKNAILQKATSAPNSSKFIELYYQGDKKSYNNDDSSADLALCSMLAYWCERDGELVDALFRDSALYREKWEREDYRMKTIEYACGNPIAPAVNISAPQGKKMELTLEVLEEWLDGNNIRLSSNEITHEMVVAGFSEVYNPQSIAEHMHVIIHDTLKSRYKCNASLIQNLLAVIAEKNRFNPVINMLSNAPAWDGIDRLEELYKIMRVDDNDRLSRTLIHKWLLMALALAHNKFSDPFGGDGVLVFQGAQGIGKTSLCNKLGVQGDLVKTGLYVDSNDKDTIIRATSCWIGELGELETTLRSDMARLKGFITADIDRYRAPYGRATLSYPRHTAFIATCNSEEFLADETGSRRFWVIPCKEKFDLQALSAFNARQLWKQIECELHQSPYSTVYHSPFQRTFRLSDDERRELEERNASFNRKVKAQNEIEDILLEAQMHPHLFDFKWCTPSQFKSEHPTLQRYSSENIGRALNAIGVEARAMRLNGKSVSKNCRLLPFKAPSASGFTDAECNIADSFGSFGDEPF